MPKSNLVTGPRKCPHPACSRMLPDTLFACGQHWHALPAVIRKHIWNAYATYLDGCIGIEELRRLQQPAIDYWSNPLSQR